MSMVKFLSLMTHDVILKKMDRDYKGKLYLLESQSLKGFVQYGNHVIRNEDNPVGEDLIASAIVFLPDNAKIDIAHSNWRIDQITPYARSNMEVKKIDPIDDPRTGNTHHYEIAVI